jgi:hypothetical protein
MNALIYAVNEIQHQIPNELLHAGMNIDEQGVTANLTSLGDKILRKVIKKRVMLDANIVGGIETTIPLNNIMPSFTEQFYTVYQIPPELVNNKEIISALSISFMPGAGYYGQGGGQFNGSGMNNNGSFNGGFSAVMNVGDRIGNAASSAGPMSNAHIELVAYNTVLVYAHYRNLATFGLRVILENDSNLNNIQPRSYKNFSTLCTLAVKAYLYNKLSIAINSGYLSGGQDLGMFKSRLEEFSSAEEDYHTYLREVWAGVAFMNDTTRYNRFLGSMIAPDL